jgi:SAM-dependent methyltransferase
MQTTTIAPAPHASYDPVFFESLFAVEDQHFWFRARNRVIATVMQQLVAPLPPGYRVLEVGCGTGNTLRVLEHVCTQGIVVGMDLFGEGLAFAQQRVRCPLVQGDMQQPPFHTNFDLIGMFDVLEHLPDDRQVLRDLHNLLVPGGRLVLTVPAYPMLWSYFDEASCHYRRYTAVDLTRKLTAAGYEIVYQTYYMASILPLVWAGRRLAALKKREQTAGSNHTHELAQNELRIVPIVNDALVWVLLQEARLVGRRHRLPVGTSLVVVAVPRSEDSQNE